MKNLMVFLFIVMSLISNAQVSRPKLVVGIVVDQMRWDYLYRYHERYGNNGFKRMLREGYTCENTFIPYTPTYTAAGHASVYTGSVPAINGIMGNYWYDPLQKKTVYCTDDAAVAGVGTSSNAGKMSPKNMWGNSVADELRLATNFKSKTIAIALKDRGSILPGGHTANAAYWFDNATGGWITSSFYMNELPDWVKKFNDKKLPDQYLKQNWNTLYPISTYTNSNPDSNRYEGKLPGEDYTFPHITSTLTGTSRFETFKYTPQANTYTMEMAKAAVENEQLGKGSVTDFLAVSFSSTDYAGHAFSPNSIEVEDMYLKLDRDLGLFFKYLDEKVGKGQYLVFLTADHAVAQNPYFMLDQKLPSGAYDPNGMRRFLNDTLQKIYNVANIISTQINYQLYLNDSAIVASKLDKSQIKQFIIQHVMKHPAVTNAIDLSNLSNTTLQSQLKMYLTNGYNQKLSGDIQVILRPQWFENFQTGSTHGSWNPYDAHIPLVWFGWKVKPGKLTREVYMCDIAPTIAAMLNIQMPNASVGKVIEELVK